MTWLGPDRLFQTTHLPEGLTMPENTEAMTQLDEPLVTDLKTAAAETGAKPEAKRPAKTATKPKQPLRFHPAAEVFPMMDGSELKAFVEDIEANGQLHAIVVDDDGLVVDGRNRWLACQMLGIEPKTTGLDGRDPKDEVLSANVRRRKMLTKSQLGIAAAESWPLHGGKPKQGSGGRGRSAADTGLLTMRKMASRWEISVETLKHASALVDRDRDAATQVKSGALPLADAYNALLSRERDKRDLLAKAKALRGDHPDLAEQIDAGKLSSDQAIKEAQAREAEAVKLRETRTALLVRLTLAENRLDLPAEYVESYDATWDMAGRVTAERLRQVAVFAAAVAELLEARQP